MDIGNEAGYTPTFELPSFFVIQIIVKSRHHIDL